MLKIFSKNRTIQEEKEELFFSLEKIVNIALAKTEMRDNNSVKGILTDLGRIFRRFLQLRKDNPDKFKTFLWSDDFFENYVRPLEKVKDLNKESPDMTRSAEKIRQEAEFLLSFLPDRELKGLTQFLNSFEKIWERAFQNGNDEISMYAIYHIDWLLGELSQSPSNELFIEQFLRLLNSITWKSIKFSDKEINDSVYTASIRWYTSIVFPLQKGGDFDLSYLELFDRYFFFSVMYIISENQTSLFKKLVSSLVEGIHILVQQRSRIEEYGHLIPHSDIKKHQGLDGEYKICNRTNKLANSENDLHTKEELDEWLKKAIFMVHDYA